MAPWRPSWISDRNDFSYFWSTSHPNASYLFESIGLSVLEKKKKIDFQDDGHGGHLGFQIGTILAMFDLQVTPMLPIKFQVSWPRCEGGVDSGELMMQNGLNKLIIPSIEGPLWNLVKIGRAVSEKKSFKDSEILYMYTAKGQGQITLGNKILIVTKRVCYFDHTL